MPGRVERSRPTAAATWSDERCLVGVATGTPACFEELVARYQHRVVNLILRIVRDGEAALDLAQDTFLRVLQRATSFRPDGSATAWILAVAVNAARDHLRAHKSRIVHLDRYRQDPSGPASWTPEAPAESIEREEVRALVEAVLAQLGDQPRTLMLLRDYEGLSYEEMAEVLSCEVGTVKSRLHRARKQFEELYHRALRGGNERREEA
ncbi:MAG: RNA polymerase sigma factor [Planctomycetota bacterium]